MPVASARQDAPARPGGTPIVVDSATKVFRRERIETHALGPIDLAIAPGEFVSVVGPSGCGKSTLMRLIAGLVSASSGRILVDGRPVEGPETRLGIVFQNPVLMDWLKVRENVLLQTDLRGLRRSEFGERALALLRQVGLAEFADRYPSELSGGMRQRAAIARALLHDPPLLLMDEPFGALDALTREQMRIDLEALWLQSAKTVVFITHSIDEAVLLSDRVVVMTPRPGRVDRIVEVPLPRPRGLAGRQSPAFAAAVRQITDLFLARGVLHDAGALDQGAMTP